MGEGWGEGGNLSNVANTYPCQLRVGDGWAVVVVLQQRTQNVRTIIPDFLTLLAHTELVAVPAAHSRRLVGATLVVAFRPPIQKIQ